MIPRRALWIAAAVVAAIVVIALGVAGYRVYRFFDTFWICTNDRATAVVSPDGSYIAHSFRRDCGATTAYGTHVFLRLPGDADDGQDERVFSYTGGSVTEVALRWQGPRTLVIEHNACTAVIGVQRIAWRDVSISYHKLDLPPSWRCRAEAQGYTCDGRPCYGNYIAK